jgi:hypothetical protein
MPACPEWCIIETEKQIQKPVKIPGIYILKHIFAIVVKTTGNEIIQKY